nr:Xaa-Pro peptidase family protein [Candidatus Njordarchaeum guaymaensis]
MIREFSNRVDRLRKVMEREELDALLLMNPRNVFYISGFAPMTEQLPVALLVPHSGEPCMILPAMELERSRESSWVKDIRSYTQYSSSSKNTVRRPLGSESFMTEVQSLIENYNLSTSTIGMEFSHVTVSTFEMLRRRLDKTGFKDVSEILLETRSVKDYEETEMLRDSLEISERGIRTGIELIQPGITELEVAAEVERTMRKAGSKRTAFDSVIASGLRSGQRLTSAKQKRIDADELVVMNVSAIHNEYCSDVARTIYTGKPGEKHKKFFELSKKTLSKAIEQITPGTTSGEIVSSVRHFLRTLSVGENTMDISGYGIGLELYEYPRIFEDEVHLIKPGMVICVKVGMLIREVGGIRIGETILVTDEGKEVLNKLPVDTI